MARKKKTAEAPQPVTLTGFKGFDKDLKCRNKQYALGETFEEGEASLCNNGLHFCEYPLDCLRYYEPGLGSRYAEVTAEDPLDQRDDDSKRVTKKLTVGGELSFRGLIEAAVKFTFERATWSDSDKATGFQGAASATGGKGAASATGDYGAASATGDYGAASATGDYGAASATGGRGAASATGFQGAASATGDYGAASATGEKSVAMACGRFGKAKACLGSWIVLAERDSDWNITDMRCAIVDDVTIKANTYYTLKDGEFVEVGE